MMKFTHISFYKFVEIASPKEAQTWLVELARALQLKGTLLLATEGINGMLAGSSENINTFIHEFEKNELFKNIFYKFSESQTQPFKRLLVKVKKEILTFNEPRLKPHVKTGKYVKPQELRQWLAKGEDIVLLDTRNQFEVQHGTFKGAIDPGIKSFTQFKKVVDEKLSDFKNKKIVTFCTGGIRCEKATAYMMEKGFNNVYQIHGGILNYLKETDGAFWQGQCFVFDERILIDKNLHEIQTKN